MDTLCSLGKFEISQGKEATCNGECVDRSSLSAETLRLVRIRSGCIKRKKKICEAHLKKYGTNYASHQVYCCNPHNPKLHGDEVKGSKNISVGLRDKAKALDLMLIPGQLLCAACRVFLYKQFKDKNITAPPDEVDSSPSVPTSSQQTDTGTGNLSGQGSGLTEGGEETAAGDNAFKPESVSDKLEFLNAWLLANNEETIDFAKLKHLKQYYLDQLTKYEICWRIRITLNKKVCLHVIKKQKLNLNLVEMTHLTTMVIKL